VGFHFFEKVFGQASQAQLLREAQIPTRVFDEVDEGNEKVRNLIRGLRRGVHDRLEDVHYLLLPEGSGVVEEENWRVPSSLSNLTLILRCLLRDRCRIAGEVAASVVGPSLSMRTRRTYSVCLPPEKEKAPRWRPSGFRCTSVAQRLTRCASVQDTWVVLFGTLAHG
jgi:hypothetical protein